MKNNDNTPRAWLLAHLRCGIPIVGVPVHPCRGVGAIFGSCSLRGLMVFAFECV
jgi:hypothetical protein